MTAKKRFELSIILGLIFSLLLSFTGFDASCSEIKREVLRLHVLANSDSDTDQQLKLLVRETVLSQSEEIFSGSKDKNEALLSAKNSLGEIVSAAQKTVYENGYSYTVTGEVCKSYFPQKEYDNFTLPAGYYDAVRIKIGKAEGKNWWCVLFPEVCLSASADLNETLSDKATDTVKNPQNYKVRFKVVEIITAAREKINSWF